MRLYDEELVTFLEKTKYENVRSLKRPVEKWPVLKRDSLILKSDMGKELGGMGNHAVSGMALCSDPKLISGDGVFLWGEDLSEGDVSTSWARIVLVRLKEGENVTYDSIRRIEYTRYHVFPEGFAMRISSVKEREEARVSKAALNKGISLADVGWSFVDAYKRNPEVEAAQVWFVTEKTADYLFYRDFARACERITESMDHILKGFKMDCGSCGQKELCDRIEGMKELHEQNILS